MPFIDGASLRERLQREGQLPLADALRLAREAADALDYAHGLGIVHRDVKPENILLSRNHALVADFGIAKAASDAAGERLTETGLSLGTPAYMSPEQALADAHVDGRSDQYSLACVLYELLAGEPPYTGPTAQAIIAKRLSAPIPHVGLLREVPPAVDAAITRALARAPADRFGTVQEFAVALSADPGATVPVAAGTRKPRGAYTLLGVGAALLLLGAVGTALWRGRGDEVALATGMVARQFTFTAQSHEPALSPDGRAVAYTLDRRALVVQPLSGGEPIELTRTAGWIALPRWSPDGRWLYFTMLGGPEDSVGIYRVSARGGTPARLLTGVGPVDVSPDGRQMVRRAGNQLIYHDAVTGAETGRVTVPLQDSTVKSEAIADPLAVAWSPDGRWIASMEGFFGSEVSVMSPRAEGKVVVARGQDAPVRWSRDGRALYSLKKSGGSADLVQTPFDPRRGRAAGPQRTIYGGIPKQLTAEQLFDVGRTSGTVAFVSGPESQHLWVFEIVPGRDTARARRLSLDSRAYDWPALTRDGGTIAVMQHALDDWSEGNYFIVPSAGGDFTPLTSGGGYKSNPAWSPDDSTLAYVLSDTTGSRLVLTRRTGRRTSIGSTPPSPVTYFRISWSADGQRLLYPARGGKAVVALDVASGSEITSTLPDSSGVWLGAVLSPDGREFMATELPRMTAPFRLSRGPVGAGRRQGVRGPPGSNMPLVWRKDGWIYLYNDPDADERLGLATRHPSIWRMRVDGGRFERVSWLPAECRFGFVTMSADARLVACAALHQEPDIWLLTDARDH
jgi:serine/threonine-protein kinase